MIIIIISFSSQNVKIRVLFFLLKIIKRADLVASATFFGAEIINIHAGGNKMEPFPLGF